MQTKKLISVDLDQRTVRGEAQLILSLRGYAGHFRHQISDLSILDDALLQTFKDKPHHTLPSGIVVTMRVGLRTLGKLRK